jgi:DNA-binding FadR family transcriptional regulator
MPLQTIETKRLYQQVADQIAELIGEGEWQAGDRLPAEREMARKLGVSRPTVREAMIALELLGMIEVRTGSGIYVKTMPNGQTVSIMESQDPGPSPFEIIAARRVIEGETAAIAAAKITRQGLAAALAAIERMERDIEQGLQRVTNAEDGDRLFHIAIAAATGNNVLSSIVDQLWEGMRHPMFTTIGERVHLPENARRAARDHRSIYECIAAGDPAGSRDAMHRHLDQVAHYLLKE